MGLKSIDVYGKCDIHGRVDTPFVIDDTRLCPKCVLNALFRFGVKRVQMVTVTVDDDQEDLIECECCRAQRKMDGGACPTCGHQ